MFSLSHFNQKSNNVYEQKSNNIAIVLLDVFFSLLPNYTLLKRLSVSNYYYFPIHKMTEDEI